MSGVKVIKVCRDCGQPFEMTDNQVLWFVDKGLHVPERCEECRRRRKCNGK